MYYTWFLLKILTLFCTVKCILDKIHSLVLITSCYNIAEIINYEFKTERACKLFKSWFLYEIWTNESNYLKCEVRVKQCNANILVHLIVV